MKKIAIIGCSGSGKSTLSLQLTETLQIPVYHLDVLNWQPNWIPTPRKEWDQLQSELVLKETWIIDGHYNRTLEIRMDHADTIILLDMPRVLCLYRVIKRFWKYRHKTRPDMTEGCDEKLDFAFLKWIWLYKKQNRSRVLDKLMNYSDKNIVILKTPRQVSSFVKKLEG